MKYIIYTSKTSPEVIPSEGELNVFNRPMDVYEFLDNVVKKMNDMVYIAIKKEDDNG